MTKVARKNMRETVAKCIEQMLAGGRFESDEAREHVEQVMQQVKTGTADDGAWADAMNLLLDVVSEVYPGKENREEGKDNEENS